ncbi:zinc finger BED domain-containing protein RICESLEEPER 2-like [Cucumis melo var. makuwa]|uniref:Zinc finger BED domain-containing protein RICESLEEPER 2-like n=1 Tax=Cucumis melo var. makuwa TaxID=1194695 RepID=A0A5A7U843_CUCMM|nr:zinc finger BED domain-containing protein RICESLEEPER 2-like [Cucumis melo var. makuwa]
MSSSRAVVSSSRSKLDVAIAIDPFHIHTHSRTDLSPFPPQLAVAIAAVGDSFSPSIAIAVTPNPFAISRSPHAQPDTRSLSRRHAQPDTISSLLHHCGHRSCICWTASLIIFMLSFTIFVNRQCTLSRDEDTDGKRKIIDVDLDSYGREDVPNPPKIRKNVRMSNNQWFGTTLRGLKHHLENCKKYPYQKKRDQTQMTLAFKPKDKVGDNSSQLVCESFSLDGCRDALVEMIIVDELPFKFVEDKGFKKFVDKLTCGNHTRFVVPSRFPVARDVLKLSSPARFLKFKKCIELEKIACKSYVCLDVPTRWNSTYMMLEAAVKFEKAFDRLEDEDASYRHDMSPNKEDWTNARMLIRFLKVFYDVTLKISGSLYTTSNLVFHQITVVLNCIRLNAGSANALSVGMANNMKAKFEKYWGNNEKNNLLLYVAIVLDPRKKLRFVSFCLKNVFDPEVAESMENVAEQCCRHFVYDTIVEEFKDDSTTPFKQGSSEIDIYLLEANVRTEGDFDILQWWKMNSDQFEVLGHMARDILAIPVSTVASESAFSTGGHVVDSSRCSLAPKTVEAFICTQNWLNSDPIHLQFQHELEEASKFEEGFRVIMENEKEFQDLPDFDKLSITD